MRINQSSSRPGGVTLPTAGQRPSSDPVSSMQPGTASSRNQAMVSSQPPPTSGLQQSLSSSGPSQRTEHSFQRTPSDSMISVANASFSGMPSSHAVGPWKGSGSVLSSKNSGGGQVMATEDPAAKMIQLMVQRNAMARATIIGQDGTT
ncbi:hypothetical protein CEUSTIGMA_g711.t1 [Chlamydomonas eustigma]|uniref:Uncharacterized protein n=1 Tax=Chlamydomonas eustigma TaxID=1157962 RepID=A0A250WQZ6_9CHLO|nr:hypothetical protein CEUSTIGMA_g711.t1 [Chlamydomonas eustigma]|eukprot:GAX73257.1 hypothetical protein CEUSTIGMA_g711.t1 [Chlamydomonas eustigma]